MRATGPAAEVIVSPHTGQAYRCESLPVIDQSLRILASARKRQWLARVDTVNLDLDFMLEVRLVRMLDRDYHGGTYG